MRMRGFAMVEVLVALAVLALAMTAALALALGSLAATSEARRFELAAGLAADLAGRMRALPGVDWSALPAAVPCGETCTPEGLAWLELADWHTAVVTTLPSGAAQLEPGTEGVVLLTLNWNESGESPRELKLGIAR